MLRLQTVSGGRQEKQLAALPGPMAAPVVARSDGAAFPLRRIA